MLSPKVFMATEARTPATKTEKMSGLGPLLSKLPTEIRFMIFGDCISSGHPEFMRTSQALQKDGQAILFEQGVYRLRLEPWKYHITARPSHETSRQIQKFDIMVDMTSGVFFAGVKNDLIVMLKASRIPGKKCKILFKADCALIVGLDSDALEVLHSFREFEELALQIEIDNDRVGRRMPACHCPQWQRYPELLRIWMSLESIYGKAEVVSAANGYCLLYHPKKHAEASKESVEA